MVRVFLKFKDGEEMEVVVPAYVLDMWKDKKDMGKGLSKYARIIKEELV